VRSGWLAAALLCAAVGFALGFAPARARVIALGVLAVIALAVAFAPIPTAWTDGVFLGCWLSVIAAAASVNLPRGVGRGVALGLAVNGGLWSGAVITVAGSRLDLARALPWVLLCWPAAWLVGRRWQLAVKVAAGWLIAVALLSGSLQLLVPTPGYKADHME